MATFQKRGTRWRAIVRMKGHAPQSKTFSTKAKAQVWAKKTESELESWDAGDRPMPTIGSLLDRHLVHLDSTSSRGRKNHGTARTLKSGLGETTLLSELTYSDLLAFCRSRLDVDQVRPSTVLHDVMFLSGAITTATVEEVLPDEYRLRMSTWRAGLRRAGVTGHPVSRDRRPTEAELELILTHVLHNRALRRIRYHGLIRFAIESSMRLSEICSLRWSDVDVDAGTVIVRLRKHPTDKQDQVVPLMGESLAILLDQPKVNEFVFPYGAESISNGFARICRHLGIKDLRFHDLRHEGISRLFERGYAIQEVAMVSGHREWKSLKRYVNLRPAELSARDRGSA